MYPNSQLGTLPDNLKQLSGHRIGITQSANRAYNSQDPVQRSQIYLKAAPYVSDIMTRQIGTDSSGNPITLKALNTRANKFLTRYPSQYYVGYVDIDEAISDSLLSAGGFNELIVVPTAIVTGWMGGSAGTQTFTTNGQTSQPFEVPTQSELTAYGYPSSPNYIYFGRRAGQTNWVCMSLTDAETSFTRNLSYQVRNTGNTDWITSANVTTTILDGIQADIGISVAQAQSNSATLADYDADKNSFNFRQHVDMKGYAMWFTGDSQGDAAKCVAYYGMGDLARCFAVAVQAWY
jgi:hypothetical protein